MLQCYIIQAAELNPRPYLQAINLDWDDHPVHPTSGQF